MISACKYCGQTAMVDAETEAEALHQAIMACDCIDAERYREIQIKAEGAILEMQQMYQAEKVPERIIELMRQNIWEMVEHNLTRAQFILPNGEKADRYTKRPGIYCGNTKSGQEKGGCMTYTVKKRLFQKRRLPDVRRLSR